MHLIGRTRDDSGRPSPGCHPESMAKDLCPGGDASRLSEILRFPQDDLYQESIPIVCHPRN
jgi:hypothetical protein